MPKRSHLKLTDQLCRTTTPPASGYAFHLCAETLGLALRVTAGGARSFVFSYANAHRRQRRITIGRYPAWSLAAARKRTQALRQAVDRGEDPLEQRNETRAAKTLGELWAWYQQHAFKRLAPSSQRDVKSTWTRLILPTLGPHTTLEGLHRRDVQRLVDHLTEKSGPTSANRAHAYVRRALNLAVAEGWLERNVATMAISRNPEHPRERYLTRDELMRVIAALEEAGDVASLCLKFIALTGCRKNEAARARWEDVELKFGVWTKPAAMTKARRRHVVPLSEAAMETLRNVQQRHSSNAWVFPSAKTGQHVVELRYAWDAACEAAGLTGVRIHDLRHTFASLIANSGGTLMVAGALLGHSQVATTARYAHLFNDTLRDATNVVGNGISTPPCSGENEAVPNVQLTAPAG